MLPKSPRGNGRTSPTTRAAPYHKTPLRRVVGLCCILIVAVITCGVGFSNHGGKQGTTSGNFWNGVVTTSKEEADAYELVGDERDKLVALDDEERTVEKRVSFDIDCHILGDNGGKYHDPKDLEDGGGVGKLDPQTLGRCRYKYPTRVPPKEGYVNEIDWFLFRGVRGSYVQREQCYLFCIDHLPKKEVDDTLLIQAAKMGLTNVVEKLMTKYGLDPLATPSLGERFGGKPGFNAIQEAIRGGYADAVKILTNSNYDLVIDSLGRTVRDYILMNGSPIRPKDAMDILSIDTSSSQTSTTLGNDHHVDLGWSEKTAYEVDETCDIDVIDFDMSRQQFYNDYFTPGRPVMLRNVVPADEVAAFSKERWSTTTMFRPETRMKVGPTAYPGMSYQKYCDHRLSIGQMENATQCSSLPGVPMVHARHPNQEEWVELLPMYKGNPHDKDGGWRMIAQWFGPTPSKVGLGWQMFFGGDGSGATFHWHEMAFNVLYAGVKQWKITPPKYRGWTGMPARQATEKVDDAYGAYALRCIQRPGDLIVIPNFWGHLTLNTGFTVGIATLIPDLYQQTADAREV